MGERMRVVSQRRFGGPKVLEIIETERPVPGPGEVLVRMEAAGVNPGEANIRAGKIPELGTPPFTLGSDVSGVVADLGPSVTRFKPGDAVYGFLMMGAYAEYLTLPADDLAAKPGSLDHAHAAALPLAALTAWQAIVELGDVREGQRVLIHAAAGGVGHLAVQLAALRGAHVIGTARAAKHDLLRELGVSEIVDYSSTDFTTAVRDVDLVVDLVGGGYGPRSVESLRPGGLLLGVALDPGITAAEVEARGLRYAQVIAAASGRTLETIAELVDAGRLRVIVEHRFPLAEIAAAHELSATGRVTGKIVLVP